MTMTKWTQEKNTYTLLVDGVRLTSATLVKRRDLRFTYSVVVLSNPAVYCTFASLPAMKKYVARKTLGELDRLRGHLHDNVSRFSEISISFGDACPRE